MIVCEFGDAQPTLQPLIAAEPAVTVTWAWYPPDHALTSECEALYPPEAGGVEVVGEGDGDADLLGEVKFSPP